MASGAEGVSDASLFSGLFAHGEVAAEVSDRALVQAMVEFEVALLRALAVLDLAPAGAADELATAVEEGALDLDLAELGRATGEQGTPVPGLLRALRRQVSGATAAHLHKGATSQDVVDTAMMLVTGRALDVVLADLSAAADACAELVSRHRDTIEPGRTLLQQALPLTFGLKAAGWLDGRRRRGRRADRGPRHRARRCSSAVRSGRSRASAIGVSTSPPSWPISWACPRPRSRGTRSVCGPRESRPRSERRSGVMGKIGRDVVLLAQTEVAEVTEGGDEGRGGSSTMPHKRNPVGAIGLVACAQRGPGLVATMLGAMMQEHERGAGSWQAEWETAAGAAAPDRVCRGHAEGAAWRTRGRR